MLSRILYAVVIGIVAAIVTYLLGGLLMALPGDFVQSLGAFFKDICGLVGLVVGLLAFFNRRVV